MMEGTLTRLNLSTFGRLTMYPVRSISGIQPETSWMGSVESRGCPFHHAARRAYAFPSYLTSRKASITCTPATSFVGISGGYAIVLGPVATSILTLNQSSILVDATGHSMITDCGLAMVTQDLDSTRSAPDEHGDSTRWIAPEILDNWGTFSKEADMSSRLQWS